MREREICRESYGIFRESCGVFREAYDERESNV